MIELEVNVYVVDTGDREIYVQAPDDCTAGEAVVQMTGELINYVEWYSVDEADAEWIASYDRNGFLDVRDA